MTVYPSAKGITVLGRDVTAHKRAEEQLHYHAALLSNVNDAIVASDAQYRITAWNSAAESMYGWMAEEVIGQSGLEIMRTEWPAQDADEMRQSIAETGRWRGEATQIRKDGSHFPVEISSMVLYDDQGQVSGYVSVNRDITERKRMEHTIESIARFPMENPNPILRIQRDGVITFANTASERLLQFWNRSVAEHLPESEQHFVLQIPGIGEDDRARSGMFGAGLFLDLYPYP
jgi:PAS domain S-box-containing protein